MTRSICIAIDTMSGDQGAQVCVPAALEQLQTDPDLKLIFLSPADPFFVRILFFLRARSVVLGVLQLALTCVRSSFTFSSRRSSLRISTEV